MTVVNPSPSASFDIDKIVRLAYRQAALANPYEVIAPERMAHGRDMLDLAVKALSGDGLVARTTDYEYVTLVASQHQYAMPATVLNVIDVAKYLDPTQTDLEHPSAELPVTPIGHVEWTALATRSMESQPFRYYVDRTAEVPYVWLWPTPGTSQAGGHIRFKVENLRASSLAGTYKPDVEGFWELALTYELAYHLAAGSGLPVDRCAMLKGEAEQQREKAKAKARERDPQQPQILLQNRWQRGFR